MFRSGGRGAFRSCALGASSAGRSWTGDSRQALNSGLVHCRFRDLAAAAASDGSRFAAVRSPCLALDALLQVRPLDWTGSVHPAFPFRAEHHFPAVLGAAARPADRVAVGGEHSVHLEPVPGRSLLFSRPGAACTGADGSFMFRSGGRGAFGSCALGASSSRHGLETGDSRQALNSGLVHCRFRDLGAAAASDGSRFAAVRSPCLAPDAPYCRLDLSIRPVLSTPRFHFARSAISLLSLARLLGLLTVLRWAGNIVSICSRSRPVVVVVPDPVRCFAVPNPAPAL